MVRHSRHVGSSPNNRCAFAKKGGVHFRLLTQLPTSSELRAASRLAQRGLISWQDQSPKLGILCTPYSGLRNRLRPKYTLLKSRPRFLTTVRLFLAIGRAVKVEAPAKAESAVSQLRLATEIIHGCGAIPRLPLEV
jgi:hypothetical protein